MIEVSIAEKIRSHSIVEPYDKWEKSNKGQPKTQYYRYLSAIYECTWTHVKKTLLQMNKPLEETKRVEGAGGRIISTTYSARGDGVDTTGLTISKVTKVPWSDKSQYITYTNDNRITKEQIEEAFDNLLPKFKKKGSKFRKNKHVFDGALRTVISDEHIGMNPQHKKSIFTYTYGKKEYLRSMQKVCDSIRKEASIYKGFDTLFIDNLGDGLDGYNKRTTRGGHELPQNLSNVEQLELFIDSKVQLIKYIIDNKITNKIVCRFVTNDNHAGDFGLVCVVAIKKLIQQIYQKDVVEIDILEKFIETRYYGDHAHLLTHGKDKEYMRRGLPLQLTPKAISFITDYINHHNIDSKYIHLDKGDLHQLGYQRTKAFAYTNFGSFAPPSAWIQHNYGDSYSCFSTQVIPKGSGEITQTNYYLDYGMA